ncbi:hypothetical protein [Nocardia sp. bgisy118]
MTMRALVGGKGSDWILENRDVPEQLGAIRVQVTAPARRPGWPV